MRAVVNVLRAIFKGLKPNNRRHFSCWFGRISCGLSLVMNNDESSSIMFDCHIRIVSSNALLSSCHEEMLIVAILASTILLTDDNFLRYGDNLAKFRKGSSGDLSKCGKSGGPESASNHLSLCLTIKIGLRI